MGNVLTQPEQRIVLEEVRWGTYACLLADHLDRSVPRFTFDRRLAESEPISAPADVTTVPARDLSPRRRDLRGLHVARDERQVVFKCRGGDLTIGHIERAAHELPLRIQGAPPLGDGSGQRQNTA